MITMTDQDLDPTAGGPTSTAPPQPGTGPQPTAPRQQPPAHPIPRTRLSGAWIALIAGAVVLLLLLIFILENSQDVDIAFLGMHGHLPLGVALLLAAICGALLVVIPGVGRIMQLRRTARQHHQMAMQARQAARAAESPPDAAPPGSPGSA
jgi:uncharacterized integral membrane protein